ncbi:MAG: hypothetical protein AB7L84_07355 [Acidimicrobiia bacterium]
MLRRLAPALLAGLLVTAAACDGTTPAVRVDGSSVSEADLLDQVEQWAGNEAGLSQLLQVSPTGRTPGGYSTDLVTATASLNVLSLLMDDELERQGIELTQEDVAGAREALAPSAEVADQLLEGFSAEQREWVLRFVAAQVTLLDELGEQGFGDWAATAYGEADIEVSSRFGSWSAADRRVVAPVGPTRVPRG